MARLFSTLALSVMIALTLTACGAQDGSGATENIGAPDTGYEPTRDGPRAVGGDGRAAELLPLCLGFTDQWALQTCGAALNKDEKLCDNIVVQEEEGREYEQEYQRAKCRIQVAVMRGSTTLCDAPEMKIPQLGDLGCYEAVAIGSKQQGLCDDIRSEKGQNGCNARYEAVHGDPGLDACPHIGSECFFRYAREGKRDACDAYADDSSEAFKETNRLACEAYVQGDASVCSPLKKVGVNEWWYCQQLGLLGAANPERGVFYPEKCGKNEDCQERLVAVMVRDAASR